MELILQTRLSRRPLMFFRKLLARDKLKLFRNTFSAYFETLYHKA